MAFPDPDINAAFIKLATRLRDGVINRAQFDQECVAMLTEHGILLPEEHDNDDTDYDFTR